ncbi:nucleolar protein 9-like isoform X1 [Artemia franciscana]|uniref:Nucleolar protein 9 n=1 Tax=Artemia franciscana TaxID=6661 RepID=A0AA88L0Z7_ARTSF|nr:hypothetical protein QYM36_014415 [Artemia franciscana]KAK2708791.1 hypothetical protein QYM36_014415 [Artemia franciscana]
MERKYKKKKSFLSCAKKFGSKGLYGKGKNIDEETYHYYLQVMKRLNENFEQEDEKEMFASNVFSQTAGSELELVCNQLVSRVLEKILPFASSEVFENFANALNSDLRIVCTDPFASQVLEKKMKLANDCMNNAQTKKASAEEPVKKELESENEIEKPEKEENDQNHLKFCTEWLLKNSKFVLNNMEEFVNDTYASHVVRTMLQYVSGVTVMTDISKSKKSRDQSDENGDGQRGIMARDKAFLEVLREFTNRIMLWPQFGDLAYNEASAATLQTLILVLNGSLGKLLPPLLDLLYSKCFSQEEGTENTLPYVFQDNCAQRTLEVALSVGSSTFYDKAYEKLFKGRLVDLCETESKFAVISLIGGCKDKEKFSEIYEELEPNFKRFFTEGEGGIMLAIAKASQKLVTKQGNFLSKLLEFSSCTDPEGNNPCLIQSVLRIQASKFSKGSNKITYAGSQMVQTLLRFNKPIKMINSMLSLPANELRDLFCDPCGSYVMDTFVSSPSIGEKSRDRLRNKLKGEFAGLASSRNGSRAFDSLWAASDIKTKATIGQELLAKEAAVSGNQWGSIIFAKHGLSLLRKRKLDWEAFQGQETKKRKLFKEFLSVP